MTTYVNNFDAFKEIIDKLTFVWNLIIHDHVDYETFIKIIKEVSKTKLWSFSIGIYKPNTTPKSFIKKWGMKLFGKSETVEAYFKD